MARSRTALTLMVLLAGAIACSDDPVEPEDQLTLQEATDLLEGYRQLITQTDPVVIAEAVDGVVIECPYGGQAEVRGTASDEVVGDTARIDLNIAVNPNACEVSGNGTQYTLSGDPSVQESFSLRIVGFFESVDVSGTTTGTLAWETEDRSGRCGLDLALTAEPDLSNPDSPLQGTLTGMLCGHQVEIDVAGLPTIS